eukprot:TRINITY_DN7714_c0_g1_i3.p2 TRINITY_DN7714_c0_g1~~TRINITY_DN7714_c0_g1_i3.p2  ORF type:complete len:218 (-),score=45.12 TRINITY_DN7714_c0_g1_i3:40-693(-)
MQTPSWSTDPSSCGAVLENGDDSSADALLRMFVFDQFDGRDDVKLPLYPKSGKPVSGKLASGSVTMNIKRVKQLSSSKTGVELEEGIMYRLAQRLQVPAIDMLFAHSLNDAATYRLFAFQISLSLSASYDNLKQGPSLKFLQLCVTATFGESADVSPATLMKHVDFICVSPKAMPVLKHSTVHPVHLIAGDDIRAVLPEPVFNAFKQHGERTGLWCL